MRDLPLTSISSAKEGAEGRFRGTLCLAGDRSLTAPLSERRCVYWEINETLSSGDPERFDGLPFWLEDNTGRILVQTASVDVAARAEGRNAAVAVVDANINQVSDRIRQLKKQRRMAAGPKAKTLLEEHRRLKELATLLCAIRAQARGNLHIGGSLQRQQSYIDKKAPEFEGEAIKLVGARFEVVLCEGAEIEVSGLCVMAMTPPGIGPRGGYRDAPLCLQLRAPAAGRLHIRGLGTDAPVHAEKGKSKSEAEAEFKPRAELGFFRRLIGYLRG